jgi:uncharacterized membrane protein
MARHPKWVRAILSADDLEAVARAVAEAERHTSAEVRVHFDHSCDGDALQQAIKVFERLGMHKTADRNGVLVYISVTDRKLAVIGDKGIHERVGEAYWQGLVAAIRERMRQQQSRDGLIHAIAEAARELARHFPRGPGDKNELSDDVSAGRR